MSSAMRLSIIIVFAVGVIFPIAIVSAADGPATAPTTGPTTRHFSPPTLPASADRSTVYLAPPPLEPRWDQTPRLLERELRRQALLIAARDDLGLATRDAVLREYDPTPPDAPAGLRMSFGSSDARKTFLSYVWVTDPAQKVHFTFRQAQPFDGDAPNWAAIVASTERISHDYPGVLTAVGYRAAAVKPPHEAGAAPDGVDGLLYGTTLFAPLAAVQRTHALIRDDGATPDRVGALVRGYANLGMLTRFQWSPDSKVFAARSLMYAQRLAVRWPDRADSYWHRAYAEAVAGLHAAALADVAAARQRQRPGVAPPPWATWVEPLCKYDLAALTGAIATAGPARAPLAAALAFASAEECGSSALVLEVGDATLRFNPACWQTIDVMIHHAGVGPGAGLTEAPPAVLAVTLPGEVALLPVTTDAVRRATANLSAAVTSARQAGGGVPVDTLAGVGRALVDATGERVEPSLVVAGRLLQETTFAQCAWRAKFVTADYGWDGGDYVRSVQPLLEGHPLKPYVDAFALPAAARPAALAGLEVRDPVESEHELIWLVDSQKRRPGLVTGHAVSGRFHDTYDMDAFDATIRLGPFDYTLTATESLEFIDSLGRVSPYCPVVQELRFRDHWSDPAVQRSLDGWEAKYAQQPGTLAMLATRFIKDGRTDDGERALTQYVKIAGDYWASEMLADLYLQAGDEGRWLSTLEDVVKRPDYGLNHAQAEVKIARHFMSAGDPKRAVPYADAAEKTKAYWAMKCDADCHRQLGDADTADRIMAEARAHYGH
jgi:hypothetical protein